MVKLVTVADLNKEVSKSCKNQKWSLLLRTFNKGQNLPVLWKICYNFGHHKIGCHIFGSILY